MDELVVRDARPGDTTGIGEAHAEAWRVGFADIFEPTDLARLVGERRTTRWPTEMRAPGFASTTLLVAERTGTVEGFLHFGPERDAPHERMQIYSLSVHPLAWGGGTAAALMDETLTRLADRGHDDVHLWTYRDAGRARRFYEKAGFTPTGRAKDEGPAGGPPVVEVEYTRPTGP